MVFKTFIRRHCCICMHLFADAACRLVVSASAVEHQFPHRSLIKIQHQPACAYSCWHENASVIVKTNAEIVLILGQPAILAKLAIVIFTITLAFSHKHTFICQWIFVNWCAIVVPCIPCMLFNLCGQQMYLPLSTRPWCTAESPALSFCIGLIHQQPGDSWALCSLWDLCGLWLGTSSIYLPAAHSGPAHQLSSLLLRFTSFKHGLKLYNMWCSMSLTLHSSLNFITCWFGF